VSGLVNQSLPRLSIPNLLSQNVFNQNDGDDPKKNDADKTYSEVPHWMHLSFVSYDGESADPPSRTVSKTGMYNFSISLCVRVAALV
jgi:hypothetical protein